jgi:CO/xanthine dehydrogenase Mo-binding subunit
VRVIESRIGGGFGQKYGFYPEEVLVPLLSILTGYPTKWVETRSENFVASYHGRDEVHFIEAAVRKDGKILGLRDKVTLDVGAAYHPYVAYYTGMNSTQYVTGAYDIQNYEGESTSVVTNKTPTGPYRGFGKLEPCFVMERLVDIISRQLTIDPTELRLRNFIPPEAFPYVIVTGSRYDSGNYPLALKKAMQIVNYSDWKAKQKEFRALGKYIGIGSALVVEATSTTRATGQLQGYYSVRLRMDPDGRVYVFTSGSEEGQGHATSIAQIIADELQVPFNDIQVVEGDTLVCPLGSGSYSSRFAIVGTAAVTFAVRQLRSKILRIAAETLKCQDDQLELAQGVIYDKNDSQRKVSIRQAAETAYFNIYRLPQDLDPGLEIVYQYKNPNVQPFYDERGRSACFSSFPYDAAIAVVEVDVANGEVKILKFVSVHDCGNLLNPLVASRQHIGALSHGIGNALYEEFVYNADGQPLATTFKDYLIPSIVEMPDLTLDHIITPTPFTPGGFKGVSETGTISAPPALANAIEDALAPLNIAIRKIPLTPIYLRSLIRESLNKPLRRER